MSEALQVNMLGRFVIKSESSPEGTELSLSGRSRRIWTLVAYLIIHRDKGLSAQELIDVLMPDNDSSDPVSTLQNNISRARSSLENLGLPGGKNLISYKRGMYQWSGPVTADYDEFERRAAGILAAPEKATLEECRAALDLYAGDFLPEAAEELWCVSVNMYYRSMYVRLCETAVRLFVKAGDCETAENICAKLFSSNPADEKNACTLMNVLISNGKAQKALEIYRSVKKLYSETYGVEPSAELEMARAAAEQDIYDRELDNGDIRMILSRIDRKDGAFLCDSRVFMEIVNLRRRESLRSGLPAQIVLMRLKRNGLSAEEQAVFAKQVEITLLRSLRAGDPVTHIGPTQFAFLLPGASVENALTVVERVRRGLAEEFRSRTAEVDFSVMGIEALNEEE